MRALPWGEWSVYIGSFTSRLHKGGVIKYETDRGGRDFQILLQNFVAQHKQQQEFPGPSLSSKQNFTAPYKCFTMNCKESNLKHWYRIKEYATSKGFMESQVLYHFSHHHHKMLLLFVLKKLL